VKYPLKKLPKKALSLRKYVELEKDTFAVLKFTEVREVDIISTGVSASKNPADWKGIYRNIFPINQSSAV